MSRPAGSRKGGWSRAAQNDSARLHGAKERYKIKLRNAGYRLVYQVKDQDLLVLVVAVGKRERNEVNKAADRQKAE